MKKLFKKILNYIFNLERGTKYLAVGILIWLIPTVIFGFNDTPVNIIERITDIVGLIFVFQGMLINCFSAVKINIRAANNISFTKDLAKFLFKFYKKEIKKNNI